ncbi:MAG: IS66 family transposase [Acetobacteraceae bacterium]
MRDDQPFAGRAPPAAPDRYSPDRKGEHPRQHLAASRGILQADGYAGFRHLYERGVTEAACWAHTRRNVFEVQVDTSSPLAQEVPQQIAALSAVEVSIRGQPPEASLRIRLAHSAPLLSGLKERLENHLGRTSGKSGLTGAIRYTLTRWEALTLMLRNRCACIDNSAAERAMRPIAVGRRNWTFAGSDRGGERATAIFSLAETAKFNGLDPEAHLHQVLERIAEHPVKRMHELLPWNFAGIHRRLDQRNPA